MQEDFIMSLSLFDPFFRTEKWVNRDRRKMKRQKLRERPTVSNGNYRGDTLFRVPMEKVSKVHTQEFTGTHKDRDLWVKMEQKKLFKRNEE